MKKIYIIISFCLSCSISFAQQPYIGTAGGDGLGQYGYLEKDAVTFSRLFRNTYDNIAYLSARWWITDNNTANGNGKEYIHNVYDYPVSAGGDWDPLIGWQCGGDNDGSKRTSDFNIVNFAPEWNTGSDCYVSVCAKFCDNSFYPSSFDGLTTNGATGFNERHFRVVDVDTTVHSSVSSNIPDGNDVCETSNASQVAGTFTISPGDFTGLSLTRLFIQNNGNATEDADIPNGAFHVFYEPVTGSEVYGDGNETLAGTLWGDWGGGSTTDNIFGSEALNIPLTGAIRVYILLCDFNDGSALGKSIDLQIINDGISLAPALDTYTKLRINPSGISQKFITLPVTFTGLSGIRAKGIVQLKWQASCSYDKNNFIIQQSVDGIHFSDCGNKAGTDCFQQKGSYTFSLSSSASYFRIVMTDGASTKCISNIIKLKDNNPINIELLQAIVTDRIILKSTTTGPIKYNALLTDMSGRVLLKQKVLINPGTTSITIPGSVQSQTLLLNLQSEDGTNRMLKILKQ